MAITKKLITTYDEMVDFLDDSGFFASVVDAPTEGTTKTIKCKDADDNIVFVIQNLASAARWYGYADANTSASEQVGGFYCTAYSTAKGLMFVNGYASGSQRGAACIVSKTNNGAYCVLLPKDNKSAYGSSTHKAIDQQAIAWGDTAPFTNLVNSGVVVTAHNGNDPITETADQTIFLPIATHNEYGTPSYFADAFFLPISQYRSETVFTVDGVKYVTDGWVCLRDE